MIKVLIVDDEALIREGLCKTVPWKSMGFKVCAEASSGEEALKVAAILKPEVIITDIIMSGMGGIELLERVKEQQPDTEFIILSGHDDFEYAKSAIENNAFAYLLKPFRKEELNSTLKKLSEKIMHKTIETEEKQMNLKYGNLLDRLLQEQPSEGIEEICRSCDVKLPESAFVVAVIQIDNRANLSNWSNLQVLLNETIDFAISTDKHYVLQSKIDKANIALLIFTSASNRDYMEVYNMLSDIRRQFEKATEKTLTIGMSGAFRNITHIRRAYNRATTALMQKAILGNNRVIDFTQVNITQKETPPLFETTFQSIIGNIKTGADKETILAPLEDYFSTLSELGSVDIEIVKNSVLELVISLLRMTVKNTPSMQEIFGRTVNPVVEMQGLELLEDVHRFITEIIEKVIVGGEACRLYSYSPKVRNIIEYIMKNYSMAITAESVAGEFYINPYHLMHLLKKETGKTFNEFLSEYRIHIAHGLLKTGKYRIYEVAYLVGYQDARHFSKKFKAITGISPSDVKEGE